MRLKQGHRISPQKYKEGKKRKTSNVFKQLEESFCLEVSTMRLVNTVFFFFTQRFDTHVTLSSSGVRIVWSRTRIYSTASVLFFNKMFVSFWK